jgi:mono/diheme cytochrome c family protein
MAATWQAFVSRVVAGLLTLVGGAMIVTDMAHGAAPEPGKYRVQDGKVDANTFQGWRIYHSACYLCHGTDAAGTQAAPSLLKRMEALTPEEFAQAVLVRYRLFAMQPGDGSVEQREQAREAIVAEVKSKQRGRKGQINMPAWETDAQVNAHILDLYAYLSARADGAIGSDRPGVLQDE